MCERHVFAKCQSSFRKPTDLYNIHPTLVKMSNWLFCKHKMNVFITNKLLGDAPVLLNPLYNIFNKSKFDNLPVPKEKKKTQIRKIFINQILWNMY